jgi:hypothetical protein
MLSGKIVDPSRTLYGREIERLVQQRAEEMPVGSQFDG